MRHVLFSEFLNELCLCSRYQVVGIHLLIIYTRINVTTLIAVRIECYFQLQMMTRSLQSCDSTGDEEYDCILVTFHLSTASTAIVL